MAPHTNCKEKSQDLGNLDSINYEHKKDEIQAGFLRFRAQISPMCHGQAKNRNLTENSNQGRSTEHFFHKARPRFLGNGDEKIPNCDGEARETTTFQETGSKVKEDWAEKTKSS
jgi:hypothetical protein